MATSFEKNSFLKRLTSMLKVDFKRAFTTLLLYIMLGISFVVPILILVMTTMMDGSVSVNPQTGVETVIEGFDNVWQIIGSVSGGASDAGAPAGMDMSLTSMCNINMLYFGIAVFVCIFLSDDFRSGYAKNLFTVRARKTDYVISKTVIGFVVGALMLVCFFIGSLIGGAVASLPFEMVGFGVGELVSCMLSKIFLALIFVAVCVLASVIAKQKLWMGILLSLGFGMLFFTMIPMISPLNSTIVNVLLSAVGGILLSIGLGAISNQVLKKTSLV